jgi:hypothetical protein
LSVSLCVFVRRFTQVAQDLDLFGLGAGDQVVGTGALVGGDD